MSPAVTVAARHVKRRSETRRAAPRTPRLTPARLRDTCRAIVGNDSLAADIAAKLMRLLGGRTIPKQTGAERQQAIRARAKVAGYETAAREFDITVRQVRRVVHGY